MMTVGACQATAVSFRRFVVTQRSKKFANGFSPVVHFRPGEDTVDGAQISFPP
jgi:hypothetical protein